MMRILGIVIGIFPFSESSQILKIISQDRAQISVIAKGWRKKQEPLLRFAEYEFNLYEPKEEGLYILKELSLLQNYAQYPSTSTWAAAEAGAELISKIIMASSDAPSYYELLRNYLGYLQTIDKNAILIFWRLFMRIFKLLGIDLNISKCSLCHTECVAFAYNAASDIVCESCYKETANKDNYHSLSQNAGKILSLLPFIGYHLQETELSFNDVEELNRFFFAYYYAHQKQTLKLKSLSVLGQFYY